MSKHIGKQNNNAIKYKQKVMTPEELRKMQLIQTEMLKDFDRVCREHGITYILDAGTLLGAIRYRKFIPWDDDIDVRMLRSEYEKFAKIAETALNKSIFFQDHSTDKGYPWLYGKLRKRGTKAVRLGQEALKMEDGVFIDIFPCDGVPANRFLCSVRGGIATVCRKILYAGIAKNRAETAFTKVFWTIVSWLPWSISYGLAEVLKKAFLEQKSTLVGSFGWHAAKDTNGFKKEWFTELTEVEFEGSRFLAPKDWNGFLTYSFGADYMTPPPIEKQTISAPLSDYYLGD